MVTGLTLGKFLPLHKGHIAMIEFGLQHCDQLIVLLCVSEKEPIPGLVREQWLKKTFDSNNRITIVLFEYDENLLPNTSVSSQAVAEKWAQYIGGRFPGLNLFISSEPYGELVARFLNIGHIDFDPERKIIPVSASSILKDPFSQWEYISNAAKPWFVKKICISGSESTGKSTLAEKLAHHFNTSFVPEMAREVIDKTNDVVFDDLLKIAALHAKTINEKQQAANKLLFCDTDVNITKSYSKYLFNTSLEVPRWIDDANHYALHIYLETDCPYVQDGTRLSQEERKKLDVYHKLQLNDIGIRYVCIGGNWDERFEKSKVIIEQLFFGA